MHQLVENGAFVLRQVSETGQVARVIRHTQDALEHDPVHQLREASRRDSKTSKKRHAYGPANACTTRKHGTWWAMKNSVGAMVSQKNLLGHESTEQST